MLRMLLRAGAALDVTDAQGETALHAAVRASNTSAARQLLAAGADARARSLAGFTPCELARAARDNELVGRGGDGHSNDSGGGGMAHWLGRMNPYSKERLGARDVEQVCRMVCEAADAGPSLA